MLLLSNEFTIDVKIFNNPVRRITKAMLLRGGKLNETKLKEYASTAVFRFQGSAHQ